ncbi:MAG TPA: NAD-dependent epimerase/dehydratase family protein [Acidimicrobiales bacterium]|jgi:nucleoside-diphosphate-sugar epimerase
MTNYLVTGGTGLIGSNVVRRLRDAGDEVRVLVRPRSDYQPLTAVGAEAFEGDIRSAGDFARAAEGSDVIIHAAALLGGAGQELDESRKTNAEGSYNAFDAGAKHGIRVVALSSTPFLDHTTSLTEESPVSPSWSDDPYTLTKGAAYVEAMRRVADEGADIVITIPGGTFGPGLSLSRAVGASSFNRVLRGGINGKIPEYVSYPVPWVWAEDVAAAVIAAATKGAPGRKYLCFGQEDARTTAAWLNLACEVAGVSHRIAEARVDPDEPEDVRRYGETLVSLSQRRYPVPWFDNSITRRDLEYQPRPLREAMEVTVAWLRVNGQIP